jgi:hypothetical protein
MFERMRSRRLFALPLAVTAAAIVAAGWLTDLRVVMHGALLAVAVVALWPLVLVGVVLGALLAITVVASIGAHGHVPLHGPGELVVRGGGWLTMRWARFLLRQRHPVVLGIAAGVLAGGLLSWLLIAILIVPGEGRTTAALEAAGKDLEAAYRSDGSFPRDFSSTDGFGRPMRYRISGVWKVASWTLTSDGYDGRPSSDDLCISGSTPLLQLVEAVTTSSRLASIRALSCPTASRR